MDRLQQVLSLILIDKNENLLPENLRKDVTCLGITGIMEPNPMMTQKDYYDGLATSNTILHGSNTWLEYISSNMNQYIETQIPLFSYNTWEIEMTIMLSELYNYQHLISVLPDNANYEFWIYVDGTFSFRYGTHDRVDTYLNFVANKQYTIKLTQGNGILSIYVDGVLQKSYEKTGTTTDTVKFGHKVGDDAYFSGNLYGLRLKANGNTVFDGVPAINSSDIPGLFDTVTGTFFTSAGTSEYVAGPIIADTELESVDFTGTQVISTGYTPNENTKIELTISNPSIGSGSGKAIISASTTWDEYTYLLYVMSDGLYWAGTNHTLVYSDLTNKHTVTIEHNKISVDGTPVSTLQNTINNGYSILTIGGMLSVAGYNGSMTFYECKIYENDSLLHDFVPVKRYADNVICLYDTVNKKYCDNIGTEELAEN